jgi:uncharacterized protein
LRRTVLADTGPLYAAFDVSDQLHDRARSDFDHLSAGAWTVAVTLNVLAEGHRLVLHRLGPEAGRTWLSQTMAGSSVLIATLEDLVGAVETIHHFGDDALTLTDALSAVAARRFEVSVWTYDHHFDLMGVDVWRPGA